MVNTYCGYEVPEIISLGGLNRAIQLDRSKDMSVHVSTCTSYDFNELASVAWKLWH
jgi:hypothetical protein